MSCCLLHILIVSDVARLICASKCTDHSLLLLPHPEPSSRSLNVEFCLQSGDFVHIKTIQRYKYIADERFVCFCEELNFLAVSHCPCV